MDTVRKKIRLLDEQLLEKKSLTEYITGHSPLVLPACCFMAGIVAQRYFTAPVWLVLLVTALCTICALLSFLLRQRVPVLKLLVCFTCIVSACLGAARFSLFYQPARDDIRKIIKNPDTIAAIYGIILTAPAPEDRTSWKFARYQWTPPYVTFYLKIKQIKTPSGPQKASGILWVKISNMSPPDPDNPALRPGDMVELACRFDKFTPPANPGQFDMEQHMAQRGVFFAASGESDPVKISAATPSLFTNLQNKLRTIAARSLLPDTPSDEQGNALLAALILDRRTSIAPDVYTAFAKTGLAHYISLSGMHLGILAGSVWWLLKRAGLLKRPRAAASIVIIAVYILIVPVRAPTLRAAVMFWFFCAAVIVKRKTGTANALALSAIVLLMFRPADLFSAGFQLSYATVAGIVLFQKRVELPLLNVADGAGAFITASAVIPPVLRFFIVSSLSSFAILLATGLSAWLGGAGILLYHFGTITPLASLWTVLVFPFVFIILLSGFIRIALAPLFPMLSSPFGIIAQYSARMFAWVVKFIAEIDFSPILIGRVSVAVILLYYAIILIARFDLVPKQPALKRFFFLISPLFLAAGLGFAKYDNGNFNCLEITVLSVGHGQAVFARLPDGKNILFDAGSLSVKNPGQKIILPFLRHKGVGTIDALALSHDDTDHINGIPEIISAVPTGGIYANQSFLEKTRTLSMAGFLDYCLKPSSRSIELLNEKLLSAKKTKIRLLWPNNDIGSGAELSDNDKSQVFCIEYAGKKVLLCSDIESFAQEQLFRHNPTLAADVVIMPHHGSKRKLLDGFIEKLKPEIIIASCSSTQYENAIKPPAVNAFYTAIDGAVTIKIKADGTINAAGFNNQQ